MNPDSQIESDVGSDGPLSIVERVKAIISPKIKPKPRPGRPYIYHPPRPRPSPSPRPIKKPTRKENVGSENISNFSDYSAPSVEGMEPQWTKQISSSTVCDWFYIFFIFNAIFVALLVFTLFSGLKGNIRSRLIQVLPAAIVGSINVLFWYLMCDRALLK
jgi:hypothetical protein